MYMLKTKVGYSENVDAFESGVETAKMANVVENPQVGLFFTSCVQDQQKLMEGAKSVLGDTPIIGCTSSAALCTQDGYLNKETGYSGMMLFGGDCEVVIAGSEKTEESPREIGARVAKEALAKRKGEDKEPDFFFMTASPANEEEYLKGIQDVIGNIPVFGGSAADNTVEGKWSIYTGDTIFSDGVAVAFFYTDKEMENVFTGAYNETTNSGVITKIEGKRTLVEIDGEPALKKYSEWTGAKQKDLDANNLLVTTITKPLGVKDRLGDLIAIRHPMYGNKDKSMNIGANLAVNTAVIQMEATVDELINSTGATMRELNNDMNGEVGAYLLVHCGGRRLGIGDRIDEVSKQLKEEAHGKPFIAVFTFGEYGVKDHGSNTTGGLMLSFTAFGK